MAGYHPIMGHMTVDKRRLDTGIHRFHLCQPLNEFPVVYSRVTAKQMEKFNKNQIIILSNFRVYSASRMKFTINLASGGALITTTV